MDDMGLDMAGLSCPPAAMLLPGPVEIGVRRRAVSMTASPHTWRASRTVSSRSHRADAGRQEAAAELDSARKTLGFKGAKCSRTSAARSCRPGLAPFWAKAESSARLIGDSSQWFYASERFAKYYFNNVIGNSLDTTMALALPDLRWRAGAVPEAEDPGRARRRLSAAIRAASITLGAPSDVAKNNLPKAPTSYLKQVYFEPWCSPSTSSNISSGVRRGPHHHGGTDSSVRHADYDPVAT